MHLSPGLEAGGLVSEARHRVVGIWKDGLVIMAQETARRSLGPLYLEDQMKPPWKTFEQQLIEDGFEKKPLGLNLWADYYAGSRQPGHRGKMIRCFGLKALAIASGLAGDRREDAQSEALLELIRCADNWPDIMESDEDSFRKYVETSIRFHVLDWLRNDHVFGRPARRDREKKEKPMVRQAISDGEDGDGHVPMTYPDQTLDAADDLTPLSPRDKQIVRALQSGDTIEEIADANDRSEKTIRRWCKEIKISCPETAVSAS
jgi:DNA-directed RNA polymerase specialized sigma24 family protein